jgi:hypothetical protein
MEHQITAPHCLSNCFRFRKVPDHVLDVRQSFKPKQAGMGSSQDAHLIAPASQRRDEL